MLLIVVGKGNSDQNEQRDDGEHHHTQHRKGEQGNVELFVQIQGDILPEIVGLFASGLLRL